MIDVDDVFIGLWGVSVIVRNDFSWKIAIRIHSHDLVEIDNCLIVDHFSSLWCDLKRISVAIQPCFG